MIPFKDDNPTRTFPFITIAIIVVNAFVFLYQVSLGPAEPKFVMRMGVIPYELAHPGQHPQLSTYQTLFTSMFIHGGFLHIIGNMLYLWVFGNNIEDFLGHFRFIFFYLISGLAAILTHIVLAPDSTIPVVGASGAIAGVLGAYFILFPRAKVHVLVFFLFFIRVIRIPAVIVLGFWFIIQVINGLPAEYLATEGSGGVAWFAHIGGFFAGALLIILYKKNRYRRFRLY